MSGKILYSLKSGIFAFFFFLTVLNVVKFDLYLVLNPHYLDKYVLEENCISYPDIKVSVCKADKPTSLNELHTFLSSIRLFGSGPFFIEFETECKSEINPSFKILCHSINLPDTPLRI